MFPMDSIFRFFSDNIRMHWYRRVYGGPSVRSITNISLILSAVLEAKHKKAVLLDDSQRRLTLQSHRRQNLVGVEFFELPR